MGTLIHGTYATPGQLDELIDVIGAPDTVTDVEGTAVAEELLAHQPQNVQESVNERERHPVRSALKRLALICLKKAGLQNKDWWD